MSMWTATNIDKLLNISAFYTAFEGEYEKDYVFPGEAHNFWEMVCVIEGNLSVCADDRIYIVKENEVVFHKPMELHKFNIINDKPARLLIFSFDFDGKLEDNFKDKIFMLTPDEFKMLMDIKERMKKEIGDIAPYYNSDIIRYSLITALESPVIAQIIKNSLENFMLTICDGGSIIENIETDVDAVVFNSAVKCMSSNLSNWITVSEIAKECGVSLTCLKNIFTKYAGMGIHKYYLNIKMQQAAEMLRAGDTVTHIAYKLNFSSQNYFSMVFKREIGVTPSEYKKKTPIK